MALDGRPRYIKRTFSPQKIALFLTLFLDLLTTLSTQKACLFKSAYIIHKAALGLISKITIQVKPGVQEKDGKAIINVILVPVLKQEPTCQDSWKLWTEM